MTSIPRATFASLLCGAFASSIGIAQAQESPTVINVISHPSDGGGQLYYALDEGFFKRAGIDIRITDIASSPAIIAAISSGAADIGFSVVGSAALARARGIAVRFVAPGCLWSTSSPTAQIVVAKNSGLRSARDLTGKTVAVTGFADLTYYATKAWIDQNGGDSSGVKFVELAFPEMAPVVAQQRVDAAALVEPFLTEARSSLDYVGAFDDAIASRFMSTGWVASDAWLRTHADVAARFAAVMRQASAWANTHHQESADILLRYTKMSPQIGRAMNRVQYAMTLDPKLLQPPIDVSAKYTPNGLGSVTAADLIWKPAGTP